MKNLHLTFVKFKNQFGLKQQLFSYLLILVTLSGFTKSIPVNLVTNTTITTPVFESSNSAVIEEGKLIETLILDVNATDGNGGEIDENIIYSITGADALKFNIASTGEITFNSVQDWNNPTDADQNNIYEITVVAKFRYDEGTTNQDIKIYVFQKNGLVVSEIIQQIGDDINGEAANDNFGSSVSFSADGNTVAIGAPKNDGASTDSGHVRVYKNINNVWVQVGADIDGTLSEESGFSISLSADGNTVAIGAPSNDSVATNAGQVKVYTYNGSVWEQLGNEINGIFANDMFGSSVSLSSNGNTLAIGAKGFDNAGTDAGVVVIFKYNGNNWELLGSLINGTVAGEQFGSSISFSTDAKTVAIGAPLNNEDATNAGKVKIYHFQQNDWVQIGNIGGGLTDNYFGTSVSLSANGNILAIGATGFDAGGSIADTGVTAIFKYDGNLWSVLGQIITGEVAGEESGNSVSLSADGKVVAIGAKLKDESGTDAGQVRIFKYDGSNWIKQGSDINGEAPGDFSGFSVSLSGNGTKVAIGAPNNDGNGTNSGHVRVFEFYNTPIIKSSSSIAIEEETPLTTTILDVDAIELNTAIADANITYAISGTDASNFNIDTNSGVITLTTIPDWKKPVDADANNIYEFIVTATSAYGVTNQETKIYVFTKNRIVANQSIYKLGANINRVDTGVNTGVSSNSAVSINLNEDGNILAIGDPLNDDNGIDAGKVKIYKNIEGVWVQMGADINGEAAGDKSGESVSLSGDGMTLAIGARFNDGNGTDTGHVRIYKFNGSTWVQVGADIEGEETADNFSRVAVSLSKDGNTLILATDNVRIYNYNGSTWTQMGDTIYAESTTTNPDKISHTAISTDGKTIAIASNTYSNYIKVFRFIDNAWAQLGEKFRSIGVRELFSDKICLSADGNTIAFGLPYRDDNGENSGEVRIYKYNGSSWQSLASENDFSAINGEAAGDFSGYSIDLSADGKVVAIGAIYNDGNGANAGHIRIYKYGFNETLGYEAYTQVYEDIEGENTDDFFGYSVSLNADGTKIAAVSRGIVAHVSVYGVLETPTFQTSNLALKEDNTAIATTVLDVNATYSNKNADVDITYTITGTDASNFNIDTNSGEIKFLSIPDWNNPADADTNNFYEFTVTANHGITSNTQDVSVYVFTKNKIKGTELTNQLGEDINGETAEDLSGSSVSLSADGTMLAIGAPNNKGSSRRNNGGHVRIYKYISGTWTQMGADIDGAFQYSAGGSVSFSANGTTIATGGSNSGLARIYQYNGSNWEQVGLNITSENRGDKNGSSISLSFDGKTVALGAPFNDDNGIDAGHVRIYKLKRDEFNNSNWVQVGNDIDGKNAGDEFGSSVNLSLNGNTVAIGAPLNDDNGVDAGHVRIYKYNGSSWVQTGVAINGENAGDTFGTVVSLNVDGNTVVIGAPLNDENGADAGHAKIYKYNGSSWVQVGGNILGSFAGDQFGSSVSISSAGNVVALGSINNDGNGTDAGHVKIYHLNENIWEQIATDINGETGGDNSGFSVSLSSDGTKVAIGAINNADNGTASGHVRVYELFNLPAFENSTPNTSLVDETSFTLSTDIDKSGTIYFVIVPKDATVPTSAEVKSGTGNGGSGQITSGNAIVNSGDFTNDFSITGLLAGTEYDVYVVAEDDRTSPNLQLNPTKIAVATIGKRWIGTTDSNWAIASNWSPSVVPLATDNLLIPNVTNKPIIESGTNAVANYITVDALSSLSINSGGALTIENNLIQNGTFTINSDATNNGSLIVKGTAIGNVTYKRHLTTSSIGSKGWHLVGAPVNGQNINSFSTSFLCSGVKKAIAPYINNVVSGLRWNYYTIDGTNPITSAGNFIKAKGYSVKMDVAGTLDFTGSLNTASNETIAITDGGDNPTGTRWNLISNPYTAAISASNAADNTNNFLKANNDAGNLDPLRAGLYLWSVESTSYVVKSLDDAAFYISPGQGFFVHAPEGGGTFANFTKEMQTHQTGNTFLKSQKNYPEIIVNISEGTNSSFTKIRYIENKTTGLDPGSDIGTFTGTNSNFEVFTRLVSGYEGINFAIQALPNSNFEDMVVPIGINAKSNKEIIFSLNTSYFSSDLKIYLEDTLNNTFTRLDELNSNYKVTLKENLNGIGRFYLHTTSTTLNTETFHQNKNITIYKTEKNVIQIDGLATSQNKTTLKIYSLIGSEMFKTTFETKTTNSVKIPNFKKGVYVIQLTNSNHKMVKKIILE